MKPVLSLIIILLLFQTLMLGSLVKIDMQDITHQKWEESGIRNQVVLDPYMMPAKDGIAQNLQFGNQWISFHPDSFAIRNNTVLPVTFEIRFQSGSTSRYRTTPVFIMNNTLRI